MGNDNGSSIIPLAAAVILKVGNIILEEDSLIKCVGETVER